MVERLELSARQIQQLEELRSELEIRMKEIDAENAVVEVSDDQLTVVVQIKANAPAAKKHNEFTQAELARILGPHKLADLNKYLFVNNVDPVWNAGLLEKHIIIQRQPASNPGDLPMYAFRAECRFKVSPEGWPPAYDSVKTTASGSREVIAKAYPPAPLFMPKGM